MTLENELKLISKLSFKLKKSLRFHQTLCVNVISEIESLIHRIMNMR